MDRCVGEGEGEREREMNMNLRRTDGVIRVLDIVVDHFVEVDKSLRRCAQLTVFSSLPLHSDHINYCVLSTHSYACPTQGFESNMGGKSHTSSLQAVDLSRS